MSTYINIKKICQILYFQLGKARFISKSSIHKELRMLLGELAHRSLRVRSIVSETKDLNNICRNLRQSDDLYILGSGHSINEITQEKWDEIKQKDSIGLNFFLLHNFVPNMYFFETPTGPRFDIFKNLYLEKIANYADVPVFINNIHMIEAQRNYNDYDFINRAVFYTPICIRTFRTNILYLICSAINRKRNKRKKPFSYMFHHSGSLSILLDFAYLNGYKRIFLLGFDMTDPRYFFDNYETKESKYLLEILGKLNVKANEKKIHLTINKEYNNSGGLLPLDEYVRYFYTKFLRNRNIELYVNSSKSPLSRYFPLMLKASSPSIEKEV